MKNLRHGFNRIRSVFMLKQCFNVSFSLKLADGSVVENITCYVFSEFIFC